jgi:hypothetical protein
MYAIPLILLYATFHAIRGSGALFWFNRVTSSFLSALATGGYVFITHHDKPFYWLYVACGTFPLFWAALAPGWGLYFACVTGRRIAGEQEIVFIDKMADSFCKKDGTVGDNRKFGFIGMTLRSTFFYGLFIFYAVLNSFYGLNVIQPLASGLLVLLMGVVYWSSYYIPDESKRIRICEFTYGDIIGLATALSF